MHIFVRVSLTVVVFFLTALMLNAQEKPRVIILTDILNEPDDEQSLIRYLVHSNLFETEALIATTSCWLKQETHPEKIRELVHRYGTVRSRLERHAQSYPTEQYLLDRIASGNDGYGMEDVNNGNDSPGSDLIVRVVDKIDSRPVWVLIWGGANTLAQAILKVRNNRTVSEQLAFVSNLRVYEIAGQDDAGAWITHYYPEMFWIRSKESFKGISPRKNRSHSIGDAGNTEIISDRWVNVHIRKNHGDLGSAYPLKEYKYEGDSPSFFYLMSAQFGLNALEKQYQGSWGARFEPEKQSNPGSGAQTTVTKDEESYRDYSMYTDAGDTWTYQDSTYFNSEYAALFRWREAFQREFQARMDWCVLPPNGANHPPTVQLEHSSILQDKPGSKIKLSVKGTDPDGDMLTYHWWQYREAGTFEGVVEILNSHKSTARLTLPNNMKEGKTLHIICEVIDKGDPPLTRYQRVIIEMK